MPEGPCFFCKAVTDNWCDLCGEFECPEHECCEVCGQAREYCICDVADRRISASELSGIYRLPTTRENIGQRAEERRASTTSRQCSRPSVGCERQAGGQSKGGRRWF